MTAQSDPTTLNPQAVPSAQSFAAVSTAQPTGLSSHDLVEAIVCAERLTSHLHALQMGFLAELARPGRCGNLDDLLDVLTPYSHSHADDDANTALRDAMCLDRSAALCAAEVAAALHLTPRGARTRVDLAIDLTDNLPATLAALRDGFIDRPRATLIADRTDILDPAHRSLVEHYILPLAETRNPGRLRPMIDRAIIAADPTAAQRRVTAAVKQRRIVHTDEQDGMGYLGAHLPAEDAVAVYTLVNLIADATATLDDGRTADARRADALSDICGHLLTNGHVSLDHLLPTTNPDATDSDTDPTPTTQTPSAAPPTSSPTGTQLPADPSTEPTGSQPPADPSTEPTGSQPPADPSTEPTGSQPPPGTPTGPTGVQPPPADGPTAGPGRRSRSVRRHGRQPHLNITLSLATLAGLDQNPGNLAGHGAVTADTARAIAEAYGTLSLTVVNPHTGKAIGASATVYRHHQALTDQILTLHGTCRFPECRMPAWRCDIDHREPFDHAHPNHGGLTTLANSQPLCRWHHLLKTHANWTSSAATGTTATPDRSRQPPTAQRAGARPETDQGLNDADEQNQNHDGDHGDGDGDQDDGGDHGNGDQDDDPGLGIDWTSPTGHTYRDESIEFTLPGEWLHTPTADHTSISQDTIDAEHLADCTIPVDDRLDKDIAHSDHLAYRIKMAENQRNRAIAIDRLKFLRNRTEPSPETRRRAMILLGVFTPKPDGEKNTREHHERTLATNITTQTATPTDYLCAGYDSPPTARPQPKRPETDDPPF